MPKIKILAAAVVSIAVISLIPVSLAHVPIIPGNNSSLANALHVDNPTKSWVVYGKITESMGARYYEIAMQQGEQIYAMLLKSTDPQSSNFSPGLLLAGPGITDSGNIPGYVQLPQGGGYMAVPGIGDSPPEYEPFGADSFIALSNLSILAPQTGTYYVIVYSNNTGNYGLAIGQSEQYTLVEWITLPFYLFCVYMWLGESFLIVAAPVVATVAAGLLLIYFRRDPKEDSKPLFRWVSGLAGLLFLGSGILTIFEMLFNLARTGFDTSLFITLGLSAMPLAVGASVLYLSQSSKKTGTFSRLLLGVLGIIGLFALGGYFVAPALTVTAAIIGENKK